MINIKTEKEIEILAEGGKKLAYILRQLANSVKPGVSTEELEKKARQLFKEAGGRPSFLDYKADHDTLAFPTALITSINNEIVHAPALPSRILREGDIVGLDIGMEYPIFSKPIPGKPFNRFSKLGGYYTDAAVTVAVGKIDKTVQRLIDVTKKTLELAINQVKPGNSLNDIGCAVQEYAEARGYSVVRDLVGHGVGHAVHEEPQVPNYRISSGSSFDNIILKPGMVIAIEPMINIGSYKVILKDDGFTFATKDESLSAHFENTVAVTKNGHVVITA
ncbi:type I methionyl aminopeptidase [bacterium]|nr:type I methionyl aminopeptidase [bacterium]